MHGVAVGIRFVNALEGRAARIGVVQGGVEVSRTCARGYMDVHKG